MKKLLNIAIFFGLILIGNSLSTLSVNAAATPVYNREVTIQSASASYTYPYVDMSISGLLSQEITDVNPCNYDGTQFYDAYPSIVGKYTSPNLTAELVAPGFGTGNVISSAMDNFSVNQGSDGGCDSFSQRSSFSGSRHMWVGDLSPGTYTIYFKVTDDLGSSDTYARSFTVPDPTLVVTCSVSPSPAVRNQSVSWSSTAVGGNGTYSRTWSGTDSLSGSTASVSKTYTTTGTKSGTITVSSGSQTKSATCSVLVDDPTPEPDLVGFHDGNSGTQPYSQCSAFGWVRDGIRLNEDISVRVKNGTSVVASGTANGYRSDLTGQCTGGTCAFGIDLRGLVPTGVANSIRVEAYDTDTGTWSSISSTPKSLTCTAEPAPTCDLWADSTSVSYKNSTLLKWSSANTTSLTGTNFNTAGALNNSTGVSTGILTSSQTYRIDGTGPGGSCNDIVTVTVAAPSTIQVTSNIATTWTIGGTESVNQSTSVTSATHSNLRAGSYSITPAPKTGYNMSVSPASGSVAAGGTLSFNITYTAIVNPTLTLTASPNPVPYNTASTLTWSSSNATSCTASSSPSNSNWLGAKALSNNQSTGNLTAPTTFTLTCNGASGSTPVTRSVRVGVLPSVNLTANPTNVTSGQSSALSWTTILATTCSATATPVNTNWSGAKTTSGTNQTTGALSTTGTHTFTLTCSNGDGSASDPATVTVGTVPAPTLTLSAATTSVPYNTATTLSWSSVNATSCIASSTPVNANWDGAKAVGTNNQSTGVLSAATTFRMMCQGAGGWSPQRSVTVTPYVLNGTILIGSNRATTATIMGGAVNQTVSIPANGTTTVSNLPGNVTYTVTPASQAGYSYTVTAAQYLPSGGSRSYSINYSALATPTATLWADASTISSGQSTMLRWTSTNATSCTGTNFSTGGALNNSSPGVSTGALTASRTYTLTCTNGAVNATSTATVNVVSPVSCIPATQSVKVGQSANFSTSGGSGTYAWSGGGTPATGANATFGTSWSTAGSKSVTITRGVGGSDSCPVTVTPLVPDYSLSRSNNITSGRFGTSTIATITVQPIDGFSNSVSLSASNATLNAAGATYIFAPTSVSSAAYATGSSFKVYLPNPVAEGVYPITITGTAPNPSGGTIVRTIGLNLTVSDTEGGGEPPIYEER